MDERQAKIAALLRDIGADYAVLTTPDAVAYATGHVVPIEAGPAPFAGGPTVAMVTRDGRAAVIAANLEAGAAEACRADVVEIYRGFAFDTPTDRHANWRAAAKRAAGRLGFAGLAAVEPHAHPAALSEVLGHPRTVSLTDPLARIRAVKTEAEIAAMRRAGAVAATGQARFRNTAMAGRTELDVFAEIRAAMENAAGERVPLAGDFLSGITRTAGFTGWPVDRVMQTGDPVISDLGPRVAGYWGDSCASAIIGSASDAYLKLFGAARTALDTAQELLRPGLPLAQLDAALRRITTASGYNYPHHSGHSLGTAVHEWPRIVPYETAVAEAGMVLMIEPGAYDSDIGGVRTELMFLVTPTGCEILTDFPQLPELE